MEQMMGVVIGGAGGIIDGDNEVFLCFDWQGENRQEENERQGWRIKAKCGKRKYLTTLFRTQQSDSIRIVIWKRDGAERKYEIIKPAVVLEKDLLRVDLEKELAAVGVSIDHGGDFDRRFDRIRSCGWKVPYADSHWITIGKNGFYYKESVWLDSSREFAEFRFSPPGAKMFNARVLEMNIDTFDSLEYDRTAPFFAFIQTVIDGVSDGKEYKDEVLTDVLKNHLPEETHFEIECADREFSVSVHHIGRPANWYLRRTLENGVKIHSTGRIESEDPLEELIRELRS